MINPSRYLSYLQNGVKILSCLFILFTFAGNGFTQGIDKYKFNESNELEIVVHIMGEIRNPGEYRVSDKTDIAELLAKAGGPTEFSNLKSVTITRVPMSPAKADNVELLRPRKQILKVNLAEYLQEINNIEAPKLMPGDIILVPRNNWHKWRHVATIVRDLSVVASAYFFYLRINK